MHTSAKYQNIRVQVGVWVTALVFGSAFMLAAPTTAQSQSGLTERFVLKADGSITPVANGTAAPLAKPSTPTTSNAAPASTASTAPSTAQSNTPHAGPAGMRDSIAASENTAAAKAVAAARQAVNSKQFGQLASFVPQAKGDVLAIYPECSA